MAKDAGFSILEVVRQIANQAGIEVWKLDRAISGLFPELEGKGGARGAKFAVDGAPELARILKLLAPQPHVGVSDAAYIARSKNLSYMHKDGSFFILDESNDNALKITVQKYESTRDGRSELKEKISIMKVRNPLRVTRWKAARFSYGFEARPRARQHS